MHNLGLKRTITLYIIVLVTICLCSTNLLGYLSLKATTQAHVDRQMGARTQEAARKIQRWFHAKADGVMAVADHYRRGELDGRYVAASRLTTDSLDLYSVYFAFEDGTAYASAAEDEVWHDGVADPSQYDPRGRGWYKLGRTAPEGKLTEIYTDVVTGKPVISVVIDLGDGVLSGDIGLGILQQTVSEVSLPGVVSFIVDDSGKVLASSSDRLKSGDRLAEVGLEELSRALDSGKAVQTHYRFNGVDKLAYTSDIELLNGERWHLAFALEESVAYAELEAASFRAVATSLVMLVIGVVLAVVVLNYLYRPVLELKEMVTDLTRGNADLTRRLTVKGEDDLAQISLGINRFIARLQELMLSLQGHSQEIGRSIEALERQSSENHDLITSHRSETDQVVSAVQELSATSADVAGNTTSASSFTQATHELVGRSEQAVGQATASVSQLVDEIALTADNIAEIERDTSTITDIIQTIGEIADQTNLLALNAAIEAARAGEQGRGFAVVADEVRALAARTRTSTAEIEQSLLKLRQGSEKTIASMSRTRSSCDAATERTAEVADELQQIAEKMSHINDLNGQIATATEQQSCVTNEVSRNMASINQLAIQLEENDQAVVRASEVLVGANAGFRTVVEEFKLQ